jgi:hypothetical protein
MLYCQVTVEIEGDKADEKEKKSLGFAISILA